MELLNLPHDIENIIISMKSDIEIYFNHMQKFQKTLNQINNINYKCPVTIW